MTWEELEQKHDAEWNEFQQAYQQSWGQLHHDRTEVLKVFAYMTEKVPRSVNRILDKAQKDWQQEWGIDGWRSEKLKDAQEKETKIFFERERIRRRITIGLDKPNERDRGQ
ncbi:hypothetical protein [Chitinophaga pinensis]|uniref:Uncharacterized protein n=1 Tax=Chitinophaga pinensis (strain ATCC 43595 / DSM 2588 / LMG 13176 / NBRC 15968 / NCIMB 11800 / UQM 2034) TaxID=485918 RepID=A0A979GTE6_CHIPD|nr:hypothetical protein [Chitinophaga pinensis]ACU63727.1 hypothetical protein Cpin_6322 [Chitinophaga pinensis DSM 2588]